jgi:hypothetical protein
MMMKAQGDERRSQMLESARDRYGYGDRGVAVRLLRLHCGIGSKRDGVCGICCVTETERDTEIVQTWRLGGRSRSPITKR